jgi:hypothetical protein
VKLHSLLSFTLKQVFQMLPAIEANPEPILEEMMNSYDEVEVV